VTDDAIIKYIEEQGKEPPDENFKVDDNILLSVYSRPVTLPALAGGS